MTLDMDIQLKLTSRVSLLNVKKSVEINKFHTSGGGGRTVLHTYTADYELVSCISNEEDYRTAGQLPPDKCI